MLPQPPDMTSSFAAMTMMPIHLGYNFQSMRLSHIIHCISIIRYEDYLMMILHQYPCCCSRCNELSLCPDHFLPTYIQIFRVQGTI